MAPGEEQQQQQRTRDASSRGYSVAADIPNMSADSTTVVVPAPAPAPAGSETSKTDAHHDSMVTVRLSEPLTMSIDTPDSPTSCNGPLLAGAAAIIAVPGSDASDDGSSNNDQEVEEQKQPQLVREDDTASALAAKTRTSAASTVAPGTSRTLQDELHDREDESDDDDVNGDEDDDAEEVNWEKLEQTEDAQTKDDDTDDSTTLLLQRLEQENAKLAHNPKTARVRAAEQQAAAAAAAARAAKTASSSTTSTVSKPRTPSMAQLRQMVRGPAPPNLRYSMIPPPPMTDLEFWGALVKDYQQTAARLPTLLSRKIHKGIPPPLRGVVWQSMSGARDGVLEEQYDRLSGESSPYEPLIGKDLGRSFPGVEMFRDPEGDGQRMLGRVLKAFSLYDTKIGYCQGLAFLVGPLLMHMPDKQAFCVLVRLMERYDLRTCFLPDLSGLHVRIFQFRELLKSNLPALSAHFDELQVDPAYVSQWFLSFFAVTCPLPMLFRIYDVVFAEGASETLMRVALSLMRKNESRLLASAELEDVLQLLLSRGLWDCYHYDADVFVEDFVSLTSEVSRENLSQLERGYRESLIAVANTRASDISRAAARFLGRIWPTSTATARQPSTLSPGPAASPKPLGPLRRSTSKQSLASTLNSVEASSASVASSASTDASTVSRDSSNTEDESCSRESTPVGPKGAAVSGSKAMGDRYLHSQIEDLLTAMSELQRNQAALANQLQREREEREEDHRAVRPLLDALKKRKETRPCTGSDSIEEAGEDEDEQERRDEGEKEEEGKEVGDVWPDIPELVSQAEARFKQDAKDRRSSIQLQSKAELREELAQVKDQLANSMALSQDFNRKVHELDTEVSSLKEQLRESHAHMRNMNQDRQRLEKKMQAMRAQIDGGSPRDQGSPSSISGGLRELKLARSKSSPSQAVPSNFGKRLSSLTARRESAISMNSVGTGASLVGGSGGISASSSGELMVPGISDHEALLLELAQCKTAEAVARQDAEESRQKLESLRKAYGLGPGDAPLAPHAESGAMTAMALFGRLTGHSATSSTPATANGGAPASSTMATLTPATTTGETGGGFWGWRR